MGYVTYHEWTKILRDALIIDQSAGKLARVSGNTGIPEDRLKRWIAKDIHLSHTEFLALHEVLSETHALTNEDSNARNAADEKQGTTLESLQPTECACSTCESGSNAFDSSD